MAPVKPPKKALKSMEKKVREKPISKSNKMKKRNYHSFSIYLFKVLRSVSKDMGISKKSMLIMNNFVNDLLEKIAEEAARLVSHSKQKTLGSREIQSAIKLIVPGELAKHANLEGMKAVTMYMNSKSQDTSD